MRKIVSLLFFLTLLLMSQDGSTIRVSSRLVQISVIVHHKNQPVADLTKSDFTVLDQGRPRTISLFSVTSSKTEIAKAAPLPPNTFSNYFEHQAGRPSTLTIILFDAINTPADAQVYARQELLKFIKNLQPQDRIALYVLGRKLKVLIDFTADSGEIQRTLASLSSLQSLEVATSQNSPSETVSNPRNVTQNLTINGNLDLADQMEAQYISETSAEITFRALEAIANHVATLPGRKNLVWITGGFPFALNLDVFHPLVQRRTFGEEAKRTTRLLNQANVAVYPVDARGLIGRKSLDGSHSGAPMQIDVLPNRTATPSRAIDSYPDSIDSMKHLAGLTGGRAFHDTNDLTGAVRSAIDDTNVTYTLGFYLDSNSLDDKFHEIKVTVDRPGVDVRYRKGYFALKEEAHTDQQRRQELIDALWSPLDSTSIPLVMRLEPVDKPEPGLLRAYLAADLRSLAVEQQSNGHWQGGIDVLIVQQDKTSKPLDSSVQTLNLDLDKTNHDALMKSGVPFGKYLRPKPGLTTVRAIVLDRVSGKIGSLIVPVSQIH